MRLTKLCLSLAAILVQTSFLIPSPIHADTYKVFTLDSDEARFVYGIDLSGDVVLSVDASSGQCTDVADCYRTYIGGVYAFSTNAPPSAFMIDDGTPCSPTLPAGLTLFQAVCNNGREVFAAKAQGEQYAGLYTDPATEVFPGQGTGVFLYLNSEGDILWNDPRSEFWFEAFDLTSQVPEPASLFLLGTGALATLETTRRRARLRQLHSLQPRKLSSKRQP
jgi:hypothetical protein